MREILFRGKRKADGQWVLGAFCPKNSKGRPCIIDLTSGYWYPIDPESIGQWTGLVDKNGVKVFEGDKVRYPDSSSTFNDDEVSEGFVEWDAECMCFYFTNRFIIEMDEFDIVNGVMVDVEVIGNIHDKAVEE